jgi:hypothetical protein
MTGYYTFLSSETVTRGSTDGSSESGGEKMSVRNTEGFEERYDAKNYGQYDGRCHDMWRKSLVIHQSRAIQPNLH